MRDLEYIYESMIGSKDVPNIHENKELFYLHQSIDRLKTVDTLTNHIKDRTIREHIRTEMKFIKSYIDELTNMHMDKLPIGQ
jgi:hypothetical protein